MKQRLFWMMFLATSLVPNAPAQDEEVPAADPAAPPPMAESVPIPPKVPGEQIEPAVNIRRDKEDNLIEEYSLDGRIYMVKVTPKNAPPYYYLDADGDGQLELQPGERVKNPIQPVYWKIKEW